MAEQGTHEELLSLGGRYCELFQLQARRFAAGEEEPEEETGEDFADLGGDRAAGGTGTAAATSSRGAS